MAFYKYLTNELCLHPFLVEILDNNGFNNVIKLKNFNIDSYNEMIGSAETEFHHYKYFKKYCKTNKMSASSFRINNGDKQLLLALPKMMDRVPKDLMESFKPKTSKYVRKRKTMDDCQDHDGAPAAKKRKIVLPEVDTSDILSQKFSDFITKTLKVPSTTPSQITYDETNLDVEPKFHVACVKCNKLIAIGCKPSKKNVVCFIKTNYFAHKCNRVLKEITNVSEPAPSYDSGINFEVIDYVREV